MRQSKSKSKDTERGDAVLEFAATLPFMLIMVAAIMFAAWLFWAQAAADVAAVRALRMSTMNRGPGQIAPLAGYGDFLASTGELTGGQTAGVLGAPDIQVLSVERLVSFVVTGSTHWDFGPLSGGLRFGGGGASRMNLFFPGPPAPWE